MPSSSLDRKSTRLNSSHLVISYAVFCLKKKTPCMPIRVPPPQRPIPTQLRRFTPPALATCPTVRAHFTHGVSEFQHPFAFFFFLIIRRPPRSTLFPYPPLFRSRSAPPRSRNPPPLKAPRPRSPHGTSR